MGVLTSSEPRGWLAAAAMTAGLLIAIWLVLGSRIAGDVDRFPIEYHASGSLDLAFNDVFCGRVAAISETYHLARRLRESPAAMQAPLADTAAADAGSVARYCSTVVEPFTHNENGLRLIETAALRLNRRLTPAALGRRLALLKFALIGVFAFGLLRVGAAAWLASALALATSIVLARTAIYQFTLYPFVLVMPLAFAG